MTDTNTNTPQTDNANNEPALYGMKTALRMIFPDEGTAPSIRTFNEWKSRGYFSTIKIGRRVFVNVDQARRSLEKRFTVNETNN